MFVHVKLEIIIVLLSQFDDDNLVGRSCCFWEHFYDPFVLI